MDYNIISKLNVRQPTRRQSSVFSSARLFSQVYIISLIGAILYLLIICRNSLGHIRPVVMKISSVNSVQNARLPLSSADPVIYYVVLIYLVLAINGLQFVLFMNDQNQKQP